MIFVFGSNLAGRHGKGAALTARLKYGAVQGEGIGPTGDAYAIPTKDKDLNPLPLHIIAYYIGGFVAYATLHPHLKFKVTRVGCGLAGYRDEQIAPFFRVCPDNCELPDGWRE